NTSQEEPYLNLKTTYSHPIAILHIHYQTKGWLENYYKSKGLPIPKSLYNNPSTNNFIKDQKQDDEMDDLWYGELTDVEDMSESESESEQSSFSSDKDSKLSSN